MKSKILISLLSLSFSMTSFGQKTASNSEITVPKAEIAFGYSFINVHPNLSPITSYNINGGGAGFVFNATPLFGIKAEFMDYTGGGGAQLRAHGYNGNVSGTPLLICSGHKSRSIRADFNRLARLCSGRDTAELMHRSTTASMALQAPAIATMLLQWSWAAGWTFL